MKKSNRKQLPTGRAQLAPKVLVVDDVDANLTAMEALLENLDCELVLAQSGNEALKQLLKHEFAVLLLDVQMPDMDGYEVAHHARKDPKTKDVPIVFLTATTHTETNVLKGYGAGAVDYLFKPIDATILRGKIRVFLDLYRSRAALKAANDALSVRNRELSQAHEELKETQAQLVHSAKMASIGALVAGVAHEVNNPLAYVISHIATVKRSLEQAVPESVKLPPENERQRTRAFDRLQEVEAGLARIQALVIKLRTFARRDEGEPEATSIKECVDAVLTMLRYRLSASIVLSLDLRADDEVVAVPGLLNQALMNLVTNALDAIDGEGELTISSWEDADCVIIAVEDTGSGIPQDILERVMEPFFTTKPVGLGTGLGLSITYAIAQRHGGELRLLPRPDRGTTAQLRLPRAVGVVLQDAELGGR